MTDKILCLTLFVIFRLRKDDLYLWLLLGGARRGGAREDPFRDKTRGGAGKKLSVAVLKKLLADNYYNSVADDIAKVEAIVGMSILDIFDDHPVFAKFRRLKTLARNREFEIMYYGKVR